MIKNLPQGVTVTEERGGSLIFNIELPKGMTEDEVCKILKKIENEHWKNDKAIKVEKRNFTDEFSEKPLIPSIGGICYKKYGHKPLG